METGEDDVQWFHTDCISVWVILLCALLVCRYPDVWGLTG